MKNVLIVKMGDVGNESEALRQVLERMNYFVCMKIVGRPNDFIDFLKGNIFDFDIAILSCHGEDGEICMPILGENVYTESEPRGNLSADEIIKNLKFADKVVLSLGCTTGRKDMAEAFSKNNTYIASDDYIKGDSALFFAIRFFYELSKNSDIKSAFDVARQSDEETKLFKLYLKMS